MTAVQETRRIIPRRPIFNPFYEGAGLPPGLREYSGINNRLIEGYFGPIESRRRSPDFQRNFEGTPFSRIQEIAVKYRLLLTSGDFRNQHKRVIQGDETIGGRTRELPWSPEYEIEQLKKIWDDIPKGGKEELEWTENAVAFAAAGFEEYRRRNGDPEFRLRPNQLYYLSLLLLNKGQYEFGSLETDVRGTELFTGEGKTFGFGLIAPIMAMRGETVHVVEPNYVSAANHANQMAQFYEEFFHIETGVVTSAPVKEEVVTKKIVTETGEIATITEATGETKSQLFINGQMEDGKGKSDRVKAWKQKIVYTDAESVAFDYLRDHQIGQEEKSGQPDLNTVVALVAEADDLMIDAARNPFIISETTKGREAWDKLPAVMGLDKIFTGGGWTDELKRTVTKNVTFAIWSNLFEKKREGYFEEGEGKDYMVVGRKYKGSERMSMKTADLAVETLKRMFGYDEEAEEQSTLANVRDFFRSWGGAQDPATPDRVANAVAHIKNAYRFHEVKNEKKVERLLRERLADGTFDKDSLQSDVENIIKQDHTNAIWNSIHAITNPNDTYRFITDAGEQDEIPAALDKVRKLFHSWIGAQDLAMPDGLVNVISNIKSVYQFHEAKNEQEMENFLKQSLTKETPKNILLADLERILKKDNGKTKLLTVFNDENAEVMWEVLDWVVNNQSVIDAANEVLFGMRESADFIGGKKPVLLDDYGFPLEKRNIQDIKQIFLQMQNIWLKAGMDKKPLTPELLQSMIVGHAEEIEASRSTDRITVPILFRKYGKLRFSSGSLLPAASSFRDIYEAEVLGIERHLPIPETQYSEQRKNSLLTRCLDNGVAEVRFMSEAKRRLELVIKAQEIKKKGNVGLFIVPDIEFAQKLKELIPWAELATGVEELANRGTLDKVTAAGTPGKIIITTWIAHRDIDVKLAPEVVNNGGGLDNVVCGLLPTERGLWQALQRAIRGDQRGTRTLMLTPEDFALIENSNILEGAAVGLIRKDPNTIHRNLVARVKKDWSAALRNEKEAMNTLFTQYLTYLRLQEERMKNQLLYTYIRDSNLERWKRLYIERQKKRIRGVGDQIPQQEDGEVWKELVASKLSGRMRRRYEKLRRQRRKLEEQKSRQREEFRKAYEKDVNAEARKNTDALVEKNLPLPASGTKPASVETAHLYTGKPVSLASLDPLVVKPASVIISRSPNPGTQPQPDPLEAVLHRLQEKYGFYLATEGIPAIFRNQIRIRDLRDGWGEFIQFLENDFSIFLHDSRYINLTMEQKKDAYGARIYQMFEEGKIPSGEFPGDILATAA